MRVIRPVLALSGSLTTNVEVVFDTMEARTPPMSRPPARVPSMKTELTWERLLPVIVTLDPGAPVLGEMAFTVSFCGPATSLMDSFTGRITVVFTRRPLTTTDLTQGATAFVAHFLRRMSRPKTGAELARSTAPERTGGGSACK